MCVCVRSSEVKSGKERKKGWRRERGTIEDGHEDRNVALIERRERKMIRLSEHE